MTHSGFGGLLNPTCSLLGTSNKRHDADLPERFPIVTQTGLGVLMMLLVKEKRKDSHLAKLIYPEISILMHILIYRLRMPRPPRPPRIPPIPLPLPPMADAAPSPWALSDCNFRTRNFIQYTSSEIHLTIEGPLNQVRRISFY